MLIFEIGFRIGVLIDPHPVYFFFFFQLFLLCILVCALVRMKKHELHHTRRRRLKINEIILQSGSTIWLKNSLFCIYIIKAFFKFFLHSQSFFIFFCHTTFLIPFFFFFFLRQLRFNSQKSEIIM